MSLLDVVAKAQGTSLLGYGFYEPAGTVEDQYTPFESSLTGLALGADPVGYDFGQSGAVGEVKTALAAVAQKDGAQEAVWRVLTTSDTWDDPAADEYLLFLSRSGLGDHVADYWSPGGPTLVPQPTAKGLDLLIRRAQTISQFFTGAALPIYQAFRAAHLDLFPQANAPAPIFIVPTSRVTPHPMLSPSASPTMVATVEAARDRVNRAYATALSADTEAMRMGAAQELVDARAARDAAIVRANAAGPGPTAGGGGVTPSGGGTSPGTWASSIGTADWLVLAAAGAGLAYLFWRDRQTRRR